MNTTRIREDVGSILALLSELRIRCCCELWCGPAAAAPILSLAWELPYAVDVGLKSKKKKKKRKKEKGNITCRNNIRNIYIWNHNLEIFLKLIERRYRNKLYLVGVTTVLWGWTVWWVIGPSQWLVEEGLALVFSAWCPGMPSVLHQEGQTLTVKGFPTHKCQLCL